MKTILAILILTATTASYAQSWGDVETVTFGDFDDHNPQLDHGGLGAQWWFSPSFEWLVFDRQSDTQSTICAMKVRPSDSDFTSPIQWDSSAAIISSAPSYIFQKNPDICTNFKSVYQDSNWTNVPFTLAAWQELDTRRETIINPWSIYYSCSSGSEVEWSTPQVLTSDGEDVKVRPLSDSSFILIWKTGDILMFTTYWNGKVTSPDTLIVTNYDSTEFDCGLVAYPQPTIAWTGEDSTGKVVCFVAQVTTLSPVAFSQIDTLSSDGDISNPRFMDFYPQTLAFNVEDNGRLKPVLASCRFNYWLGPWQQMDLVADSLSDNLNAVGVNPVRIIIDETSSSKLGKNVGVPLPGVLGLFAWERRSSSDTALVFSDLSTDTIRSTGYNRNPAISTYGFMKNFYEMFPCVWESNRMGQSHIYCRVGFIGGDPVIEPPRHDQSFVLNQNYPNPFNPTTTIGYRLPTLSNVTLKIYDVLGRLVETLVDGRQIPGEHSATFDARRLASGEYFYQLRAGGFVETKKMILEK